MYCSILNQLITDNSFLECCENVVNILEYGEESIEDAVIMTMPCFLAKSLWNCPDKNYLKNYILEVLIFVKKHYIFDLVILRDVNVDRITNTLWYNYCNYNKR